MSPAPRCAQPRAVLLTWLLLLPLLPTAAVRGRSAPITAGTSPEPGVDRGSPPRWTVHSGALPAGECGALGPLRATICSDRRGLALSCAGRADVRAFRPSSRTGRRRPRGARAQRLVSAAGAGVVRRPDRVSGLYIPRGPLVAACEPSHTRPTRARAPPPPPPLSTTTTTHAALRRAAARVLQADDRGCARRQRNVAHGAQGASARAARRAAVTGPWHAARYRQPRSATPPEHTHARATQPRPRPPVPVETMLLGSHPRPAHTGRYTEYMGVRFAEPLNASTRCALGTAQKYFVVSLTRITDFNMLDRD